MEGDGGGGGGAYTHVHVEEAYLEFLGELIGDEGGHRWEEWSKEDTHIPDINCNMEEVQHMVQKSWRHHKTCNNRYFHHM